jgi:hypothetical protein
MRMTTRAIGVVAVGVGLVATVGGVASADLAATSARADLTAGPSLTDDIPGLVSKRDCENHGGKVRHGKCTGGKYNGDKVSSDGPVSA